MTPKRLSAILALLISVAVFAADKPVLPPKEQVISQMIARSKVEDKNDHLDRFTWSMKTTEEKFDKNGSVEEHTDRLFNGVVMEGKQYHRLVEKNGKPLTGDDSKKEQEREQKFLESLKKPPKEKKEDDEDNLEMNEELISRFIVNLLGTEQVSGRNAYVLTFLPRRDIKLPEKKRIDRLVNRLEGKLWVDAEFYSVTRAELHLTEPVSIMGLMGNLRRLDFEEQSQMIAPGIFAPRSTSTMVDGRKLFSGMHVKETAEYFDYRPMSQAATPPAPSRSEAH